MGKEIIDRRVTQRIPFETEVTIQFSDGKPSINATATNMSVGGMHFVLPKGAVKLPPEEIVTLNFQLPDRTPVSIRGEVCRFSNSLDHNRKPIVCYAVKFQEVSQFIWSYIYEFCQIRFGGEELDTSQRPVVAPEPLQGLNQGAAPARKTGESSLTPTNPSLMEWTLQNGQDGKTSGEEISSGSFITPPDEPLMNWIFNDKFQEQKESDASISKGSDSAAAPPENQKKAAPEPVGIITETVTEPQNVVTVESIPFPAVEKKAEETPPKEKQESTINALEESMAELLKQMDSKSAVNEVASTFLEEPIPLESAPSDASLSGNPADSTANPPIAETNNNESGNVPVPEPNDVEQPPLKRSLFSWSRKTATPQENSEKESLSENNGLSLDSPSTGVPLKQDSLPSLDFDVNFRLNASPLNPEASASTIPEKSLEPEITPTPEKPAEPVEIRPVPPKIEAVPVTPFHPEPTFNSADSIPVPPKEPEQPSLAEEIDISFMNRNSSMISLDQQMIDRIIHAMRTNSKKDPTSNK